jgi:hypothetical protein
MRPVWPALTRFYGIKPWEIDLLTSGEIEAYVAGLPRREEV